MTAEELKVPEAIRTDDEPYRQPSVTISVFLFWIVPVIVIAAFSRFAVDTAPLKPRTPPSMPVKLDVGEESKPSSPTSISGASSRKTAKPTEMPSVLASKPTSYIEIVTSIEGRRLDWEDVDPGPTEGFQGQQTDLSSPNPVSSPVDDSNQKETPSQPRKRSRRKDYADSSRGSSSDPARLELLDKIEALREIYRADPNEISNVISLADALRVYDVQFHDGGSVQEEAIDTFQKAVGMLLDKRQAMIDNGEDTKLTPTGTAITDSIYGEMFHDYGSRSVDGMLCGVYTSLGKVYFMANLFEKSVESYTKALEIEPLYLDALSARGSSLIILGEYTKAGEDLSAVMEKDESRRFQDVFTGLARILQAKESAVPGGWAPMMEILNEVIPLMESQLSYLKEGEGKEVFLTSLNRLYHVIFLYHDVKTKDTDLAFEALTKSYEYKMSAIPPWNSELERQKLTTTKEIFNKSFFPEGVGSQTRTPIFIIGFVRSGSTLLERVLDSHPQIVGTGENSVFNGQLDMIRNKIVQTSVIDSSQLPNVIENLADGVVSEMQQRWKMMVNAENPTAAEEEPLRLADKMLTNYYNVGFIHMLFPNALILHVAREPMDTIFSAYKHEFPTGALDYTSSFASLSDLYHSYRDLINHWDRTLPGRITHIRYEDMVNDMPGVARKIIEATGLEWDDGVLDFHKKKHAVNTLSTTQVRRGVYKDSLQAWRRYEDHLKPLLELVGSEVTYDLKTTLSGYVPPPVVTDEADTE